MPWICLKIGYPNEYFTIILMASPQCVEMLCILSQEPIIISTYILFNEKIRYSLHALSSEESLKGIKESEKSRGLCIQDISLNEVSSLYFKMRNRMKLTAELKFFHMFNLRSFIEIICIMIILNIYLSQLLLIQMAS